MVKDLLASYLPVPAVGSIVQWLPRGQKPRLRWPYSLARIEFSISTSHEQMVVALARWPVGVDIQWKEELRDVSGLLDSSSSSSLWSRAEAVVKMRGTGLDELERFVVHGISPVRVVDATGNHTDVVVTDLNVPEGYSGAVAACGPYQVMERTFDFGR